MKISERMLEDWICERPREIFWHNLEIIGRQIDLPHGRLDILAWGAGSDVLVIELKARPLQEKDIGQVARYCCDINLALTDIGRAQMPEPKTNRTLTEEIFASKWQEYHTSLSDHPPAKPVLIGSSVDANMLAAAFGVNVSVFVWSYKDGSFTIDIPNYGILSVNGGIPDSQCVLELSRRIVDRCHKETEEDIDRMLRTILDGTNPLVNYLI